jgi:hypothetical protein
MLAAIRPDDWDLPLFLHVLGAMLLVGGLLTGGTALAIARGQVRLLRLGYFSLLVLALPGWILMRAAAEWIYDKQGFTGDDDPAWVGIGFITAEGGGVLLLIALILGGFGVRRVGRGGGSGLMTASAVLALVALVAYLVAVWAMGGKPD